MHACTYYTPLYIFDNYKSLLYYCSVVIWIVMKEYEITQNSFPVLSMLWYTQLGAWPNTRRSPVRLATPSARATAEPFSSSVNRAAIKSTRMWTLLMFPLVFHWFFIFIHIFPLYNVDLIPVYSGDECQSGIGNFFTRFLFKESE